MGWCTAQCKMLLFCAKMIVKESRNYELARLMMMMMMMMMMKMMMMKMMKMKMMKMMMMMTKKKNLAN